jgi:hypothetical protein
MASKDHADLEKPLTFGDPASPRRAVVLSCIVALAFIVLVYFPELSRLYEKQSALKNFLDATCATLALGLAILELVHSGEANEHRKEQNRLTEKANEYRDKANRYREDAIRLQEKSVGLQAEVHQLQEGIEKKLTQIRIYINARLDRTTPQLSVANLSEFDVWIERVDLIVTQIENGTLGRRLIDEEAHISGGHSENGFKLYGGLVGANRGNLDPMNAVFCVEIVAVGVTGDAVTIKSRTYHFTSDKGKRSLQIMDKPEGSAV